MKTFPSYARIPSLIHRKAAWTILSIAIVSCSSEGETVQEAITADDIRAFEGDLSDADSELPESDWALSPADETEETEPASFGHASGENSEAFITAMTDVDAIERSFQDRGDGRYVVQPGDSLSGIATKIYGSTGRWREIAEANNIGSKFVIHPGDTLRFDVDTEHAQTFVQRFEALPWDMVTVQKGDTLGKIAERLYGSANYWKFLMTLNEDVIASPDKIFVGAKLKYVRAAALNAFAQKKLTSGSELAQAIE